MDYLFLYCEFLYPAFFFPGAQSGTHSAPTFQIWCLNELLRYLDFQFWVVQVVLA